MLCCANETRWELSGVHIRLMAEIGVRINEIFLEWLKKIRFEIAAESLLEE
jgi:hypothetical protein